jgi:uncharacterized membrane protein YdbT with pleckstrin-like domain
VRPPARALVRRCGPWLLLLAPIAAAASIWPEAVWGLPVPLIMAGAGYLSWLRAGHLYADDALYVGSGLIGRRLWIIPYDKLQTLSSSATPLQRLLNLANVVPDTAGAALLGAPEVEDLPLRDARTLSSHLLGSFYAARAQVRARSLSAS